MAGQASRNPSPGPHPVENSMHQKRNIISPCRKQETSECFRVAFQEWLFTCRVHAEWEPSLSRGRERGIQKAITRYYKLNAVLIVLCFLVLFIVKVQQFVLQFFSIQFGTLLGNGCREMNHRILSCLSNYAENTPWNEGNKPRAKFNS